MDKFYDLLNEAFSVRSSGYLGLYGGKEYDEAAMHVGSLIHSSFQLFDSGFHAPSLFLTITSFEELAKIKGGFFRSRLSSESEVKRRKDPLYHHSKKHGIALEPILLIGDRLAKSMGKDRVTQIFNGYADGSYSTLREESLYFSRDKTSLKIPAKEISRTLAAEHLLIAIEAFDDFCAGMSPEMIILCKELNIIYRKVEDELKMGE